MDWVRPFRRDVGGDCCMLSSTNHLSCWDCEHIRVAGMPARMCVKYPDKHIYSPGPIETEVLEEGIMGEHGSVADRCGDFQVAWEFPFLLVIDEVEA